MLSLILKLISPLIAVLISFLAIWNTKDIKDSKYCWLMIILSSIAWIATSGVIVLEDISHKKAHNEMVEQTMILEGLRASQGESSYLEKYISAQRKLIAQISVNNSQEFFHDLKNTLSKKVQQRKDIDAASNRLSAELMVCWEPAYDLFKSSLEDIMNQLEKKGAIKIGDSSELPILTVDKVARWKRIRDYIFKDGSHLYVNFQPARIEAGRLVQPFRIVVRFNRPNDVHKTLLIYEFQKDRFSIKNYAPQVLNFKDYVGGANPMAESGFIKAVKLSIDRVAMYGLVESHTELQ